MNNRKCYLAALAYLLAAMGGTAQNLPGYKPGAPLPCRAHEQINAFFSENPQALERHNNPVRTRATTERPDAYVIPVVFHVFGEEFNGVTLNDEIIQDALKKTNEDFQGITVNTGDDNPDFNMRQANMNITFKLAEKGPDGEATTGILYHRLESGFGNYYAPRMALYAWDNHRYMNVYVMNDLYGDGETNNSGVSWYPDIEMTNGNLARVVYNGAYIGTNTDENFRRVLTHEFGHFLNLAHTFDDNDKAWPDGCNPNKAGEENPGDWVEDTPKADRPLMGATDLNCEGELTNWTNYMNYSYIRTSMFTKGQVDRMLDALDHPARTELWQKDTHEQVFFTDETVQRIALSSRGDILETSANDGSFDGKFEFTLINGTLADKEFVYNTDFFVEGLPDGLAAKLQRVNDTKLSLSFEGKAIVNDRNVDLKIIFKKGMLANGELYDCKLAVTLECRASYVIKYVDCEDIQVSSAYTWEAIQLDPEYEKSNFGVMWNSHAGSYYGNLFIESYSKKMIGARTNLYIVNYGDEIGAASTWSTGLSSYPNLGTLVSKGYDAWKGKIAFVGIQFEGTFPDETLYGWMRVSVADDGSSFTLLDYAFNEAPGETILAGQREGGVPEAEIVYGGSSVTEDSELNDGTINQTINIVIMGNNTFKKLGELTVGSDYHMALPQGLVSKLEVVSEKKAVLSFSGKAEHHDAKDLDVLELTLESALFSLPEISNLSLQLAFNFLDSPEIIVEDLQIAAGADYGEWTYFTAPAALKNEYGAWEFAAGHLKLETYSKPMVCLPGTRNIEPLAEGTEIGANSNWVVPGEYPDQLDLATREYADWHGKTAYAGFRFEYLGKKLYGWFKITVAADGSYFTIDKYGYNEKPGQSILAGRAETVGTGMQKNEKTNDIFLFPNPVREQLSVTAPEGMQIAIYNASGVTVWSGTTDSFRTIIPVSSWSKGFYFVRLSKDGINVVEKIIVR